MTTKQIAFLREIAFKYHPTWSKQRKTFQNNILSLAMQSPRNIDVESITEEALAYIGGYNFIDSKMQDFDDIDKSDSKTVTITVNSRKVEIGSIENKIGALRITIWNPILDTVDYMFIPYCVWKYGYASKCYGKNTNGKMRLQMTWNADRNDYNKFEVFRLGTFKELAEASEAAFYEKHPTFKTYLTYSQLNTSLPVQHSEASTKNHPMQQISISCNSMNDLLQNLDQQEIQPNIPSC